MILTTCKMNKEVAHEKETTIGGEKVRQIETSLARLVGTGHHEKTMHTQIRKNFTQNI